MGEKKFYICKHCGNMIGMIKSSGVNVVCCGDPMTELKPNTVEASQEKHLPVFPSVPESSVPDTFPQPSV